MTDKKSKYIETAHNIIISLGLPRAQQNERSALSLLALLNLTPGKPWRSYLADLNYHCYHVSLLRSLARLYPGEGLETIADRWQGYVDARSATGPAR